MNPHKNRNGYVDVDLDLVTDVVVVPRVFVDRATKSIAASLVGRSSAYLR
jgi:hypothetical protein